MNLTIWRHFQIQTPDDWEIVQFSRNRQRGHLHFADRYQYRMVFHWVYSSSEPDLDRLADDSASRLRRQDDVRDVTVKSLHQWRGAVTELDDATHTSFAAYYPGERCLIEVTFFTPGARDERMENKVLKSIREEPAAAGYRRWRAFGMDLLASDDLPLQRVIAQPANAQMVFGEVNNPLREEKFERLGLIAEWLTGSVADWVRKRAPREVTVREQTDADYHSHHYDIVVGDRPVAGASRLLGRRSSYAARAWICPVDGRLYCATVSGGKPLDGQPPLRNRLRCCDDVR